MARRATPQATEHTGHATGNGNGNGNGHGQGGVATAHVSDKPMAAGKATSAYQQLKPGERKSWTGISVERRFTREGVDPYDTVEWDTREAVITNEHGKVVFEQRDHYYHSKRKLIRSLVSNSMS
jgi:hypothetical protein